MSSTFRFVWDGNVLLHETFKRDNSEHTELTTWVFEGFVPTAKLVNGKAYSIISDHLGTPILAIDSEGNEVWNRQLDIYGRVKREIKASSLGDDVRPFIPFLYQGQYYDFETKLAYNRFRYYSPETGAYISQDPIGLEGNNPNIYGYVGDNNWSLDRFGLSCTENEAKRIAYEKLDEALNELDSLSKNKRKEITTVVVGVNLETGEVAVGMKNSKLHPPDICAEDIVVEKLGGDASKVKMTKAVRPRNKNVVSVCKKCQLNYNNTSFFDDVTYE